MGLSLSLAQLDAASAKTISEVAEKATKLREKAVWAAVGTVLGSVIIIVGGYVYVQVHKSPQQKDNFFLKADLKHQNNNNQQGPQR